MAIETHKVARIGLITVVLVFGGLGAWIATAPLHGAVVVGGLLKVSSYRKTIQHNEGGIVRAILVREGDQVRRGQTLIQLEDAEVSAEYAVLRGALDAELARQARLQAEAVMQTNIDFPLELRQRMKERTVAPLLAREQALFASRRAALNEQARLIELQIEQIDAEINALGKQRQTEQQAGELANRELQNYRKLQDEKFVAEVRVLSQMRLVADYQARTEEREAESARARQRVQDLRLRVAGLRDDYVSRAAAELKESGVRALELRQRLNPSLDALRRQAIVAPVAGRVIGLRVHTEGATIGPRDPLMDIVPEGDALIIEAQAPLDAIKELRAGQIADIRFTALPYRTTPMVKGELIYISPDALADQEGHNFYQVHIRPDPDSLRLSHIDSLAPGMAAEVYLQTQSRTALEYLLRPITDSLLKAFRER